MNFNKYEFRKEVISRLKKTRQHFADISDIANAFMCNDPDAKKEVERELVHLSRNMKILDIKEVDAVSGSMNDDWLRVFKSVNLMVGDKIAGLYASLTKDYFANQRQKRFFYLGIVLAVSLLLFWAIDKFLSHPS